MAPTPLPDHLWNSASPELQAAIVALVQIHQQQLATLEARVNDLEARLKLNSSNSSKPPSSDPIGFKRKPPAPRSGKKRGGQAGHRKACRPLVPPEKVHEIFDCKPTSCRRCGDELQGDDPTPLIHQVAELPKVEPIVDEYRLHRLACPGCGETTCGTLPPGIPRGGFGPHLQAVMAVFAGAYRLSKRQIQQLSADLFGLSISTGMISKLERRSAAVLEAPYNELAVSVHSADAANIDETSWRQDRKKAWLWVTVTRIATVFTIARHRSGEVARALLGSEPDQVVGSDRFSAYEWIAARGRQICWAHLRRDFQAMIDRGTEGKPIGEKLLKLSHRLFHDGSDPKESVPWNEVSHLPHAR
jgi:transposase